MNEASVFVLFSLVFVLVKSGHKNVDILNKKGRCNKVNSFVFFPFNSIVLLVNIHFIVRWPYLLLFYNRQTE